jgi:hypothetical protein
MKSHNGTKQKARAQGKKGIYVVPTKIPVRMGSM